MVVLQLQFSQSNASSYICDVVPGPGPGAGGGGGGTEDHAACSLFLMLTPYGVVGVNELVLLTRQRGQTLLNSQAAQPMPSCSERFTRLSTSACVVSGPAPNSLIITGY